MKFPPLLLLFPALLFSVSLSGCAGVPKGVQPVTGFEPGRYVGKWYEIARLDHSFERGLSNVSAEYALKDDGGIDVTNRGYNEKKGEWKTAKADAWFRGDPSIASLNVRFFWPFHGGYHVIALDKEAYQWALVCGPSKSYLWLLCRDSEMDPGVKEPLVEKAEGWGFDVSELIFVKHDRVAE